MEKSKASPKTHPHYYSLSVIVAIIIVIVAAIIYYTTSFSSVRESITELEKLETVDKAYFEGDKNQLVVVCNNGKKLQIELEDTASKYSPVVSDFCR